MLRWKYFVQSEDDAFVALIDAFTKATGVKVNISRESYEDVQPKASVAANTGAGPDLFWGLYSLPHLFPQKCVDVSDVADYLGKKYGGWVPSAVTYGKSGNKWIAIPICYSGNMLPIFVQAAPRWRGLFGPLNAMRSDFPPITPDFSTSRGGFSNARDMTDPELVQQSLAVLRAYLAQAGTQTAAQIEHTPAYLQDGNGAATGSGNGRSRMSPEEALHILGLEPTATAQEIRDAYCRLEQKVDPELGGTHYLMAKIIEARDVLLRA